MIRTQIVSSLEKCFLDQTVTDFPKLTKQTIFKNQTFAFQVLVQSDSTSCCIYRPVIEGIPERYVSVREVVNVPSDMPAEPDRSEGFLRTSPGLFPDLLQPLRYNGQLRLAWRQARALWIEIDPAGELTGSFSVRVSIHEIDWFGKKDLGERSAETLELTVADVLLPDQQVIFTQWFYPDCLADYYHVDVFSDRHFEICENFVRAGVKTGRNMFLLPLLTPALDTREGGERTTCQLITVYKDGGEYTFSYDILDRWLGMYQKAGVRYYEVSHFFTQWGAKHAPKVMAYENGEYKRIFGWETDAVSPEYRAFLRAFIKGFLDHMRERGEDHKCYFHISDEPLLEHLPQYLAAKGMIEDLLEGYPIMDAMSNYEFYEQGVCAHPVPATRKIEPFLEHNVKNLWCYFCGCARGSNVLMAIPLSRVRYLGMQLFKYDIEGFLHWGYNFYNNYLSYDHVNPFLSSTGESFVPSGDTYIVYPAPDGTPFESTRMRVLFDAFQDLRAMRLCETFYSHEEIVNALEAIGGTIEFSRNMTDAAVLCAMRQKITDMILEKIK